MLLAPRVLSSQERGAIALGEAVQGLGVNTRVLMIGAHPDDEDSFLIAWLSRGRHVETAYLSLTRGDGGQNIIGNELGDALGVLRTEELLAARRIDGAKQFFTRAYDFGFSKDTVDTYKHWPRDSILGDVVRIVRAFRPHVIVAVFSGTPRDGHGHHQVSGLLARVAYDSAGNTKRFPVAVYGTAWTPLKFYRAARFNPEAATLRFDVGETIPRLGRSIADIASESRSQHKSQGFGPIRRSGPFYDFVRLEASRVNAVSATETSLFDGIDTTWARFRAAVTSDTARKMLDLLPAAFAATRSLYDLSAPQKLLPQLDGIRSLIRSICPPLTANACQRIEGQGKEARRIELNPDLITSLDEARIRVQNAMRLASGVTLSAKSVELLPLNVRVPVFATIRNESRDTVAVGGGLVSGGPGFRVTPTRLLAPGAALRDTLEGKVDSVTQPWWLIDGRSGDMFVLPARAAAENQSYVYPGVSYGVDVGGASLGTEIQLVEGIRASTVEAITGLDTVEEAKNIPVAAVPAIIVNLDQRVEYVRANTNIDRELRVRLHYADVDPCVARVSLTLPRGLVADSASRSTRLKYYGDSSILIFRVRGRLPPGEYRISANARANDQTFTSGYDVIDYPHIRRQRIYHPASVTLSAVDIRIPTILSVLYIAGVGDNVAPTLTQLGIRVSMISAAEVPDANLNPYTTVVVGPRAYEAHPDLIAANQKLFDFARNGGTLVVQYGQNEMTQPGALPYPITLSRPADRVTEEDAPVTIDAPDARELTTPNRIGQRDFANWVQERTVYMPHTFDEHYHSLISMNDTGEPPNRSAILVAPLGRGVYVYSTLSFFRQLPAGNTGAARLFVNLLSAGLTPGVVP